MLTPEEMRELLLEEFGISSDLELEEALRKIGGIRIALFTDPKPETKEQDEDESFCESA